MEKKLEDYSPDQIEIATLFCSEFMDFIDYQIDKIGEEAALSMAVSTLIAICKKYGCEAHMKRTVNKRIPD